jgi:hypothetical protein
LNEEFSLQLPTQLENDSDGTSYSETCTEIVATFSLSGQPDFVTISETGLLEILPTTLDAINSFTFIIFQTEENGQLTSNRETEVTLTVYCDSDCGIDTSPYFTDSLLPAFVKFQGEEWSYQLPTAEDPLGGTVQIRVQDIDPSFLNYDSESQILSIAANDLNEQSGSYVISINLITDSLATTLESISL